MQALLDWFCKQRLKTVAVTTVFDYSGVKAS